MRRVASYSNGLALILPLFFLTGCSTWADWGKTKDYVAWPFSRFAKDYQNPQRIAAIWSHDIMTMPGKPAARGFGGRLYFYNEKSIAVPVKGELMVYGYEESTLGANGEKKTVPDKKFRFTAEQFAERFSESDLGASYSIWIPWDDAGGDVKRVTLIPLFKQENGQIVHGDAAELTLPGKTPDAVMAMKQPAPANGQIANAFGRPAQTMASQMAPASYGLPANATNNMLRTEVVTHQPPGMPGLPYGQQPFVSGSANGLPPQAAYQGGVVQSGFGTAGLDTAVHTAQYYNNNGSPAGYQSVVGSELPTSGLKTTTIQVPTQVANRMGQGAAASYAPVQPQMSVGQASMMYGANPNMVPAMPGSAVMPATGYSAAMPGGMNMAPAMAPSMVPNMSMPQQAMQPTVKIPGYAQMPNGMNPAMMGQAGFVQPNMATGGAEMGAIQNPQQLQQLPTDSSPRRRRAPAR